MQPGLQEERPIRHADVTGVPLLDLKGQYADLRTEIAEAMNRVLESQHFILGPEVEALEREIAGVAGVKFGVGVSSGTDALLVALMALDVGPGDEVITTTYSFFATAGVIWRLGATPVFVDIDGRTFNIDPRQAVSAMTKRTKAIIPVHLFGRCADLGLILEASKERGIAVVEDAAQAIGAHDTRGRAAGSIGDMGCFSFFPTKNLGAFGDGGMVVTNDSQLAARLRRLRAHGSSPKYHHAEVGGNFRLDALQAAVVRAKLPHLAAWSAHRRTNAAEYRLLFKEHALLDPLILPEDSPGHVYNQFVIRAPHRDELRDYLKNEGVATEIYYPVPLHLQKCFMQLGHAEGDFPNAEAAADSALALPIYPEIGVARQRYVVGCLQRSASALDDGWDRAAAGSPPAGASRTITR